MLSRVQWLQDPPSSQGGLPRAVACPAALDSSSQPRWASTLPRVPWLQTCVEGSRSCLSAGRAPSCHAPHGPLWAASYKHKKKGIASLPMRLGLCVRNVHTHVSKTCDVRAIMSLQDMRASSADHACKTCRQAATVWPQCSVSSVNHSPSTVVMPSDSTA
jgi:hypothetical protein